MRTNVREYGKILLPKPRYVTWRTELLQRYNAPVLEFLDLANQVYSALIKMRGGQKGHDYLRSFDMGCSRYCCNRLLVRGSPKTLKIHSMLFPDLAPPRKLNYSTGLKPRRPSSKDLPLARYNTRTLPVEDFGFIRLLDKEKAIEWDVTHPEEARNTYVARCLFNLLNCIRWTRSTGGTIFQYDENGKESIQREYTHQVRCP